MKRALAVIHPMKFLLTGTQNAFLQKMGDGLNPCQKLKEQLSKWIKPEPPVNLAKGGVMADGINKELDELRHIVTNSEGILAEIRDREAKNTGIENLKIAFNNVFGYYLEVTNKYKNKGLVPENWVRKQTLTNAERYITEELKVLETKILSAQEKILALEQRLYDELVEVISGYIQPIQHNANIIAQLDCLLSFAKVAAKQNYCRPSMNDGTAIEIKEGRHPVIEQQLELGESYVPNDVFLDLSLIHI